jgi:NitT/TauT family transport system substrate-binding protein
MQTEWKKTVTSETSTPIAGTVVMGALSDRADIVNTFNTEYQKAVKWMLENPEEAGNVGARALTEQGFTAPVLTESMNNIDWHYVSAQDARADIEAFFEVLTQVSPNYTGGKLPDDGFYYQP